MRGVLLDEVNWGRHGNNEKALFELDELSSREPVERFEDSDLVKMTGDIDFS